MNSTTRALVFLLVCIGLRVGFVFASAIWLPTAESFWQWTSALSALGLAAGWVYIYRYNARPVGIEAGGNIWWNHLRPVHAALYASFAVLALTQPQYAFVPLTLDVIIGLSAWINKRVL